MEPPKRNLSAYDTSRFDAFIRFITEMLRHSFVLADSFASSAHGTMQQLDALVMEHQKAPASSKLKRIVPSIGTMHTPLACTEAFTEYDAKYQITKRTLVPPSEDEVRHILNLAQVFSSAEGLRFISFDGDETLYADGGNFAQADATKLARYIEKLLVAGVAVALVTAAGYKGAPEKYEVRLDGLLKHLEHADVPDDALARFYVVGGECNFLFECQRVSADTAAEDRRCAVRLREAAPGWCAEHAEWPEAQIVRTLDIAEAALRDTAACLQLRCRIIRKERAVGMIPGGSEAKGRVPDGSGSRRIRKEHLDETALRLQLAIADAGVSIPTCCFNGGADVWCDIGNKAVGVKALQQLLGVAPAACLHVGDQFSTSIGNDFAARLASPTLWVAGPKETQHVLKQLLERRGISTKAAKARPSWPPSTKRTSIFLSPGRKKAEPGDAYHVPGDSSTPPKGVFRASSLDTGLQDLHKGLASVKDDAPEPDWVRG